MNDSVDDPAIVGQMITGWVYLQQGRDHRLLVGIYPELPLLRKLIIQHECIQWVDWLIP